MASAAEMVEEISRILGRKVYSPYHLDKIVEERDGAEKVEEVTRCLRGYITHSVCNRDKFCESGKGIEFLQRAYNRLCDKFEGLEEQVGPKYEVEAPRIGIKRRGRKRG